MRPFFFGLGACILLIHISCTSTYCTVPLHFCYVYMKRCCVVLLMHAHAVPVTAVCQSCIAVCQQCYVVLLMQSLSSNVDLITGDGHIPGGT